MLLYLAAFCLAAFYNVLWTQYSRATTDGIPARGALWAGLISLVTSIQVLIYMHAATALIPQVAGAAIGAFWGIRCHQIMRRRSSA